MAYRVWKDEILSPENECYVETWFENEGWRRLWTMGVRIDGETAQMVAEKQRRMVAPWVGVRVVGRDGVEVPLERPQGGFWSLARPVKLDLVYLPEAILVAGYGR